MSGKEKVRFELVTTSETTPVVKKVRKRAAFKNWQPKKWTVRYEQVLLLYVSGKKNYEIAEIIGIHVVHVGNILGCEFAKGRLESIRERLGIKEITSDFQRILATGLSKIVKFVEDEGEVASAANPLGYIDRVMKAVEMVDTRLSGGKKDPGGMVVNNNTLVLASQDNVNKLLAANEFSQKVKELAGLQKIG